MGRMSRTDYEILYAAILEARESAKTMPNPQAVEAGVSMVAHNIARLIQADNRAFKPDRFLAEVGYVDPTDGNR